MKETSSPTTTSSKFKSPEKRRRGPRKEARTANKPRDIEALELEIDDELLAELQAQVKDMFSSPLGQLQGVEETAERLAGTLSAHLQSLGLEDDPQAKDFVKRSSALMATHAHRAIESSQSSNNAKFFNSRDPATTPSQDVKDEHDAQVNEKPPKVEPEGGMKSSSPHTSRNAIDQPKFDPNPSDRELPSLAAKAVDILVDQYGYDPRWSKPEVTRAAWAAEDLVETLRRIDLEEMKKRT